MGLYSRWMDGWETRLANLDQNRVERPFDWGLDWLGFDSEPAPRTVLQQYNRRYVECSDEFFRQQMPAGARLQGSTLSFPSQMVTPYEENNTVWGEYFPSPRAAGRAVLVLPQWNSDDQSHIGLCRLLQRLGLSALRMSKAYHHRRMPPETMRADYHVSANLGRTIHATRQSVVDARACLDWLGAQGYTRLGILGTSLGSCVALLTAAHDPRIQSAVFNHVSMNFSDVVWTGMSCRHIRSTLDAHVTQDEMREYWRVISPSAYLHRLAGRPSFQSLLIWAGHDTTFRPEFSRQVLDGFARHRIPHKVFYLPCGHYTTAKWPFVWMDGFAMCRFLLRTL
ncbi:MAG: abhydrolase domain-containing 18 [Acidobacteria bacterium]|nr:abhydrolase domain-containing 18 [Acidobacteriota bacterium]